MSRLAVFFHPRFSDGGVERTNIYLARGLIEMGYAVTFLTTSATPHFRSEVDLAAIKMEELGSGSTLGSLGKVIRFLRRESANNERVIFISCQYYVNVVSMLAAVMLRWSKRNIRFINSERNHFDEFAVNGGLKNRIVRFLVPRLYRFADLVIANSKETAEDLGKLIGRKVYAVYNPTINPRIRALSREAVEESWFTDDTRPCVLAVGRFSRQKDFSTLLQAFHRVRESSEAKLVILGEGELLEQLRRQVGELGLEADVYLPGFVVNPYKFMVAADLFVLSSRYEGLPNALIEAVFLGIPCVSTSCKSGPREVLLDGEGGYLVPVGDSAAMAQSILRVLQNPAEAAARAEVALAAVDRFDYDSVKSEFEKIINL